MSRSWSGRLSRREQDQAAQAAQAAQDGAVAAFLDLDRRQSYLMDAIDALVETSAMATSMTREWEPVKQESFTASAKYLAVAESHSLLDAADRPTGVDPAAASAAFTDAHRGLADAAVAVDKFYRRHADELEQAKSLRAATPKISAEAKAAAITAEGRLTAAEKDGFAYPSVMDAAGELIDALSALKTAETVGSPLEVRHAAAAVHAAVETVDTRISTARSLLSTVRGSLSSVKTRIEAITTRLGSLPATRSALLREFSTDCSKDLKGADERAQRALAQAQEEWVAARKALDDGHPEPAAHHLTTARSRLTAAEADGDAMGDRLRLLRQTKADPAAAAKSIRFKLRDAQLLVVDRGLVKQWGSVLDAQAARIERAAAELTGTHPNYWTYLQALESVESFVRNVIDRVRGEAR